MTNEEKAKEIGRKFYYDGANDTAYRAALQMAIQKDSEWTAKVFGAFGCDTCPMTNCEDCKYKIIKRKIFS